MVPLYISRVLCQAGRVQSIVLGPIYISQAHCLMGRSQSIVLGSYVYIQGSMADGKVPEYNTGFLCIYPGPYVRQEGPGV